jgi:hypothetical protein
MSTSQESYPYRQLPQDDTFRYLVLQPGTGNEPLVCQLQTAPISATEYHTVSYVWGTEIKDHTITCDGYAVKITANLATVLRRVRLPDRPLSAWADGICINQEDKEEKGHQVALMGKIYRSAVGVFVHIGSDDNGHGPAVCSLLDEVDNMVQSTCKEIDMTWDSFPYPGDDDALLNDTRWNSLYQLLSQSWFDRGWVVQEAALAAQGEVMWGQSSFNWEKLMWTYTWLLQRGAKIFYATGFSKILIEIHTDNYLEGHKDLGRAFFDEDSFGTPSILRTLNSARDLELKDQRDRIYAFLDLPHNGAHRITMRPDYFAPYLETYRQFAVEYIRSTKSSELLEYVCHDDTPTSNVPSWIPRWDVPSWSVSLACLNAWETLQPSIPSTFAPIVTEDGRLKVRGVIIDCVHYISDPFDADTITPETIRRVWECINTEPIKDPYTAQGAVESHLLDAFLHALCSGTYEGEWLQWRQERNSFALKAQLKSAHPEDYLLMNSTAAGANDCYQENLFFQFIRSRTHKRRFVVTGRGYMGLSPLIVREGDACGIIFGCKSPCILRKTPHDQHRIYIGATALMGSESIEVEESGVSFVHILGAEDSKDWVDWDVEEQDIYLC